MKLAATSKRSSEWLVALQASVDARFQGAVFEALVNLLVSLQDRPVVLASENERAPRPRGRKRLSLTLFNGPLHP